MVEGHTVERTTGDLWKWSGGCTATRLHSADIQQSDCEDLLAFPAAVAVMTYVSGSKNLIGDWEKHLSTGQITEQIG